MFEQVFKNIDDVLWKEAGCTKELDYTEQTSWMLFLKYLDDLEQEKAMIEVDEYLNRDDMREELVSALYSEKESVTQQLLDMQYTRINKIKMYLDESIKNDFIPARDGM